MLYAIRSQEVTSKHESHVAILNNEMLDWFNVLVGTPSFYNI